MRTRNEPLLLENRFLTIYVMIWVVMCVWEICTIMSYISCIPLYQIVSSWFLFQTEINCEKKNQLLWLKKKRYVLISLFSRTVSSSIIVVFRKDRSSLKVHFLERFSSGELLGPEVKECGLSWKGSPKTKIGNSSGTGKGLVFLFEPLQGHMLLFWRSMKAGKSNKRVQRMIKKKFCLK